MNRSLLSAANNDLVSPSFDELTELSRCLGVMIVSKSKSKPRQIQSLILVWAAFASLFLFVAPLRAASQPTVKKDSVVMLLSDMTVQLECTQALNDLYNFKFETAERSFNSLKRGYGWHPLPYFLLGLSEWWKIMPNTSDKSHDDRFLAYMDTTITVAERIYDELPQYKAEASFFLAAAHGFKGRLYSDEERKNWRKAAASGKEALNYLEESKGSHNLSVELIFGDGLFNYFSVWVPENYPALKPVLWFFPKGDKALGLKQLKEVSYNAFYTRTEAMVWLMRILNSYENDQPQAFQISKYLAENYPDNPFFHRYYARMLYSMSRYTEAEPVCKDILTRIDSGMLGYEATSGRYAAFFLGQIYEVRKKYDDAIKYYNLCITYAEQLGATDSGYYLYSLIALGEIHQIRGDKKEARRYFKLVKEKAGRKDEAFKDAKRRLKKMEKRGD